MSPPRKKLRDGPRTLAGIGILIGIGVGGGGSAVGEEKASAAGRIKAGRGAPQRAVVPVREVVIEVTMSGLVDDVDRKTNRLIVKDRDGERTELQVAPDVVGFDRLKKGDPLNVTYFQSVALALAPAPTAARLPAARERELTVRHPLSGGVSAHEIVAAAPLIAIDEKNGTLTFKAGNGATRMVSVTDVRMKEALRDLRPGDVVALNYTEAVATVIAPGAK